MAGEGSPYRGARASAPAEPAREDGLVQELIQQFADPLAFYRELVQNSIDSGATAIAVTLGYEEESAQMLVSVRDDGCGMGRATLENELTVLFRSGKEKDSTKIGKFGVGFVSVLAVAPQLVVVRTSRGEGEQLALHLHPDQTYDLFRTEGSSTKGTSVTLHVPVAPDAVDEFVAGSERALRKWCRHTEIPVRFVATSAGRSDPLREGRIDTPFDLDAWVAVHVKGDGRAIVAGLPRDGQPYVGFFKRGLLLHETTRDGMGAVAVKIQDSGLEHTLSRDNVRRTESYERAMRAARHAIDTVLAVKVEELFAQFAQDRREPPIDVLIAAAERAELLPENVRIPLVHPHRGASTVALADIDGESVCLSAGASALTELAAHAGAIVVDVSIAAEPVFYRQWLAQRAGKALPEIGEAWVSAHAVELAPSDLLLVERTGAYLEALARRPPELRLVQLEGLPNGAFCASGVARPLPTAIHRSEIGRHPFSLLRRPPLWIDIDAPITIAARYAAEDDPTLAAAMLARAILLVHGALDDDAWIARALTDAIDGEPA